MAKSLEFEIRQAERDAALAQEYLGLEQAQYNGLLAHLKKSTLDRYMREIEGRDLRRKEDLRSFLKTMAEPNVWIRNSRARRAEVLHELEEEISWGREFNLKAARKEDLMRGLSPYIPCEFSTYRYVKKAAYRWRGRVFNAWTGEIEESADLETRSQAERWCEKWIQENDALVRSA